NRPASSSTYSRPKPPTRSAPSSTTRSPAPTAPPFRQAPAADIAPNPGKPLPPYPIDVSFELSSVLNCHPERSEGPVVSTRPLLLPKKLPKPQPHLHRIHPRIRHGQPGI